MKECFTCHVVETPKLQIWLTDLVVVNHYVSQPGEIERPGWFIVSPLRHITRWWELTPSEHQHLAHATSIIDRSLTEHYNTQRTMVASLGWNFPDHIHIHCVPIGNHNTHRGYEVFQGDYVPLPHPKDQIIETIKRALAASNTP